MNLLHFAVLMLAIATFNLLIIISWIVSPRRVGNAYSRQPCRRPRRGKQSETSRAGVLRCQSGANPDGLDSVLGSEVARCGQVTDDRTEVL